MATSGNDPPLASTVIRTAPSTTVPEAGAVTVQSIVLTGSSAAAAGADATASSRARAPARPNRRVIVRLPRSDAPRGGAGTFRRRSARRRRSSGRGARMRWPRCARRSGGDVVSEADERQPEQRRSREQALDDLVVVHAEVGETAVAVGLRPLVDERAGAEPLDEAAELAAGDRLPGEVHLVNRDPPLLEEADGRARGLIPVGAEDLDAAAWFGHRTAA